MKHVPSLQRTLLRRIALAKEGLREAPIFEAAALTRENDERG
jgi:hypothetical protein